MFAVCWPAGPLWGVGGRVSAPSGAGAGESGRRAGPPAGAENGLYVAWPQPGGIGCSARVQPCSPKISYRAIRGGASQAIPARFVSMPERKGMERKEERPES